MSSAGQQGSPGAPHLSYSTPATASPRRSSYASVAAGNPTFASNVPVTTSTSTTVVGSTFNTTPIPSVNLPRTNNSEQQSRIPQPVSGPDYQSYGNTNVPESWGRGASNMTDFSGSQSQAVGNGASSGTSTASFFRPSYLRGSRYMERLEAANEAKLAAQLEDAPTQPFKSGPLSTNSSNASLHKMAPSHRGMTYDIVENEPLPELDGPAPLPSRWTHTDKWGGLEIGADGQEVRFVGASKLSEHEAAATRSDHPMPSDCGIYYFEVTIHAKGKDGMIGVGFSSSKASLEKLPGWEPESWAYHGDDGHSFCCQSTGRPYGPHFSTRDIIGCGVNFITNQAFFTKNGNFLNYAFKDIRDIKLYPSVGMKRPHAHVEVNFGQRPFFFDIDTMVKEKKDEITSEILMADVRLLHPVLSRSDLCKALVAQYLSHDGYNETAKAFTSEVRTESIALSGNAKSDLDLYFAAEEDHDAAHRQQIRTAILDGDIDEAIKLMLSHYPRVICGNPQLEFRLKCRKFIEMMRNITEYLDSASTMSLKPLHHAPKHSKAQSLNGHHTTAHSDDGLDPEMDLDDPPLGMNGNKSHGSETLENEVKKGLSAEEARARHQELLHEAVFFGQELKRQFRADQNTSMADNMTEIFAMFQYPDPREGPQAYLLDPKQRTPVAEAVNSAILVSLGKSSSTALERLYKQTVALTDLIAEDGGIGSLVNVPRLLRSVQLSPSYP